MLSTDPGTQEHPTPLRGREAALSRPELPDWRLELGEAPEWLLGFPRMAGWFLALGGAVVLAGWAARIPSLEEMVANMPKMFPINAFSAICLGVALLLRQAPWPRIRSARRERYAAALVALTIGLGLLRISQYLSDLTLPFDLRLFPLEGIIEAGTIASSANAAPPSALNFVLLGIALLLPRHRAFHLFQALLLLVLLIACLSMGRYLYGGDPLFPIAQMSIPTSIFQIVAALAALCLRTDQGLMSLILAPTAGGMLIRRLLVPALVLPPFLGWIGLAGQRSGFYQLEAGTTIFAYANVILFGTLAWWAASWLNRTDMLREEAEVRTHRQLERLSLLQQITRATAQRQDPASIFEVVLRALEDRLPVEFSGIWLIETNTGRLKLGSLGDKSRRLAPALAEPEAAAKTIARDGIEDCLAGQLLYERDLAAARAPFLRQLAEIGLRSAVLAPLEAESRVFGLLVVGRARRAAFTLGATDFLTQLSDNVAIAAFQAELHGELETAYIDLRTTQQAALERDRLRALGEMASGIAHDLNNSISPAALHLESLLEKSEGLPDRTRERLEVVRRAVYDAAHTVSRMQVAYRHHASTQAERIQLNLLIEQVLDLTRAKWRDTPLEKGEVIEVQTRLEPNLPLVRGNESEIREALTNLVFNAVDAMPGGGVLIFRSFASEELSRGPAKRKQVAVELTDTGIGMDAETRRRCLEPFFTTKGERGSGLGLSRVFGVAERHGGAIEIDSEPGTGTTVRLIFPALAGEPDPPPAVAPSLAPRLRMVVVDDDPTLLETLKDVFEEDGHEVVAASGGAAGIEIFGSALRDGQPFDLVVTDLGMPQVDGRQVAAAIKALSPTTPIVLLTGWGHRIVSEQTLPPNFDLVLSKPPRLAELRQAVKRLMSGEPADDDAGA